MMEGVQRDDFDKTGSPNTGDAGQDASAHQDMRRAERADVQIIADVRETGGNRYRVEVLDLSISGFRMHSLNYINPEVPIFLTLPSFAPLEARVVWRESDLYGCQFASLLHKAVFDHIVRLHPALK